jgi:hypothetical protein
VVRAEDIRKLEGQVDALQDSVDSLTKEVAQVMRAFPDGVENHRAAHEAQIAAAKAQADFYTDLRQYLISRGIVAAVIIVLGLIWLGIQIKLGIAVPTAHAPAPTPKG